MGAPGRQAPRAWKPGKIAAGKDGKAVVMSRDRKDGKIAKAKGDRGQGSTGQRGR